EDQLEFPVLYTNARTGTATTDLKVEGSTLEPLFETILKTVPPPHFDPAVGLQFRVAMLDWDDYVGRLIIGRVVNGRIRQADRGSGVHRDGRAGARRGDGYRRRRIVGRMVNGRTRQADRVSVVHRDGSVEPSKVTVLYG